MITVVKGQSNRLGFTLEELAIKSEPRIYVFSFVSENSPSVEVSMTREPDNAGQRLQIFEITEGDDITFPLEGFYSFEVKQSTSGNLVETGLLLVEGEETSFITASSANPVVYEREN
jgi:hypothetical protein